MVNHDVYQRIVKALNFDTPDRPPVWEMIESEAVYSHFAPGVPYPECAGITCAKLGIDATYGCYPPAKLRGQGTAAVVAGDTVWSVQPVFRTLDDLRSFRPARIDERRMEEDLLAEHDRYRRLYEPHTMYLPQDGGWEFIPGYDTETFSVVAVALAEDIPALERFWDYQMELAWTRNRITARRRLSPVVQCCMDVAYKTGLMVSPEILRKHFFPRSKQVIAPLKAAGIKAIWHSDGNITNVLDDALEAGFDGIDPLERTAGMDLEKIRRKYGKKLILVGNVDSGILKFGTPVDVRRAVRECITAAGKEGGHFLQSDAGQIMPDVSVENVIAYLEEARKKE